MRALAKPPSPFSPSTPNSNQLLPNISGKLAAAEPQAVAALRSYMISVCSSSFQSLAEKVLLP